MSQYKVDKNIPIPAREAVNKGKCKYPFADMQVGDSFGFNPDDYLKIRSASCNYITKGNKVKFKISKIANRVWRIE